MFERSCPLAARPGRSVLSFVPGPELGVGHGLAVAEPGGAARPDGGEAGGTASVSVVVDDAPLDEMRRSGTVAQLVQLGQRLTVLGPVRPFLRGDDVAEPGNSNCYPCVLEHTGVAHQILILSAQAIATGDVDKHV